MAFSNPIDFLRYLQENWTLEKQETLSKDLAQEGQEFMDFSIRRFKDDSIDPNDFSHKKNHYDKLIYLHVKDIEQILTVIQKQQLKEQVAIGSVNSTIINAVCTTDGNQNFAVVLNSSLLTYLHKYGKVLTALSNPSSVIHCNRKPPNKLTENDLKGYLLELPKIYFKYNAPKGPLIHLNDQSMFIHMSFLDLAEKFIICHELGHYFRKHLDSKINTEVFLEKFQKVTNSNHELEFEADDFSFDLIQKLIRLTEGNEDFSRLVLAGAICLVFEGLNSLNPYASESHPASIERKNRLLNKLILHTPQQNQH